MNKIGRALIGGVILACIAYLIIVNHRGSSKYVLKDMISGFTKKSDYFVNHNNCIFCKIIAHQSPAKIIAENDRLIVIRDIAPKAPIHYLIIPKKHIPNIVSLEKDDQLLAGEMLLMAKQLSFQLPDSQAFRLIVNNGADVGQTVFHLHIHFLADKLLFDY